ncbi:MAG: tyrosine-type recombinase/integrase [Pirellulaceae bacterium]
MIPTTDTPLRDYYLEVFKPERLAGHDAKYVREHARAIAWLEMAISKKATLEDLNAPNLRRMGRMMQETGCAPEWVKKMTRCVSAIWRHAHQAAVVARYESVTIRDQPGKQPSFLTRPPKVGTLRRFYLESYRPGLKRRSWEESDPAVKQLDLMARGFVMLADVNDELLQRYVTWLAERGRGEDRIGRYVVVVKQVIRAWDPTRFPKVIPTTIDRLPPPAEGTLRHFFETVHLPQRILNIKPMSVSHTRWMMLRLREHYGRDILLSELTDALAAEHFVWLRATRGMKATTINNGHRATLFCIWRNAYDLGLVPKLPRVRKLKEQRDEPDSWGTDELSKLLAATSVMKGHQPWPGCIPCELWWRAFILVGWWTGLRASSLRGLELCHVDIASRWLYVPPTAMKTGKGKRFRLGQDAIDAIVAILEPPRKLLFEWPYKQRAAFWRHFRKIQEAAGLIHNERAMSRLHKLRRSVATQAAVHAGLPAAIALLDHSGPEITRRYLDPSKLPGCDATEFLPVLNVNLDPRKEPTP